MFPQISFLSQFWRNEKGKIALIFILVTLSQLASLAEPFFFTRILDDFLRRATDATRFPTEEVFFRQVTAVVVIWVITAFAARTFKNLQQYLVETVSDRIGIRIFDRAFQHVLALPLAFHAVQKPGEVMRKITKAREDITTLFSIFYEKIFQNSFSITLVIAYVFWKSWQLGIALVGFVPIFFGATWFFTRRIRRVQAEINRANEQIAGTSVGAINNIEVVQAFAAESHEREIAEADNRLAHENLRRKTVAFQQLGFAQGTIVNLARVALLWWGSILAFRGVVTFGDVVLFTFYSFAVYQPLYEIGSVYSKYHEGIASMERLQTLLQEPAKIASPESGLRPQRLRGDVEFRAVSFSYDSSGGRHALENLSFRVPPGRKLALVGPSGSGKSTIVKLLLRFYDARSGEVIIDGNRVQDYDLGALRSRIGLVTQDTFLFNATLMDNIRYGSFGSSEAQVATAAHEAYLKDVIARLPDGLHTLVGERGVKLSGGERQRVAIARAIIKKPDILVFDEATSALDSHSEEMIRRAIHDVSKKITTITVAHRFATVVDADEILVLREGKIMERGNHRQLLDAGKEYAQLYNLQTQRHEKNPEI